MIEAHTKIQTPVGPIYLSASERGLTQVGFRKPKAQLMNSASADPGPAEKILAQAVEQLEEYFAGCRKNFDLPFDVGGTEFQKNVWRQLQKIPYGKTASYRDLARKVKNEKAVRAVGSANGKNPLGIIVPCHRIIAADGSIGGYAGGIALKKKLLELEARYLG